jgi:hypothetical protein
LTSISTAPLTGCTAEEVVAVGEPLWAEAPAAGDWVIGEGDWAGNTLLRGTEPVTPLEELPAMPVRGREPDCGRWWVADIWPATGTLVTGAPAVGWELEEAGVLEAGVPGAFRGAAAAGSPAGRAEPSTMPDSSSGVPSKAARPRPSRLSLLTFQYLHAQFQVSA